MRAALTRHKMSWLAGREIPEYKNVEGPTPIAGVEPSVSGADAWPRNTRRAHDTTQWQRVNPAKNPSQIMGKLGTGLPDKRQRQGHNRYLLHPDPTAVGAAIIVGGRKPQAKQLPMVRTGCTLSVGGRLPEGL